MLLRNDKAAKALNEHQKNVSILCEAMGRAYGLSHDDLFRLVVAARFHDIGKLLIPDSILNKPDKLNDKEFTIVRKHSILGYKYMKHFDFEEKIARAVLFHHERYDGTGYPMGLKGESIPLLSRIISVADAFCAMTEDRPYRKAMSRRETLVHIESEINGKFDGNIVQLLIREVRL
ncbi:HDIG domain-containing protein [Caldanaerobius fijiensis DSM 17918]|uniref:HDIG domain-containing protein n=1 Tax=Caldanaerobius fijiensis DSM 17918 TaxID=1121256 RepID=A0A1M5F866_9THEO|nr:HD domain-containing phosphohydrolase [Caldanaerobius fijiensis]SHF87744.1 HDIG domain-containing protein [Caldanaerobius fijiensis DSM 17918]